MSEKILLLAELTKAKIAMLSALSCSAGFLLTYEKPQARLISATVGILLLACGSCAMNQYQERRIDALMERTRNRPLPSGRISAEAALVTSLILMIAGVLFLYFGANIIATLLGLFAAFWYNGVYTYLKRHTAFAVIPGALIGAIPPAVGYAAAGHSIIEIQILSMSFFFYIWQVPHFWLLLIKHGTDYQKAGLPSLTRTFSPVQLKHIVLIWTFSAAVASLIMPLFGVITTSIITIALILVTAWLMFAVLMLLFKTEQDIKVMSFFARINVFALLIIVLCSVDKLFF